MCRVLGQDRRSKGKRSPPESRFADILWAKPVYDPTSWSRPSGVAGKFMGGSSLAVVPFWGSL